MLDNNAPNGTYNWTTMAERLQDAGISWKCYQQADNYGTNVLEFFSQFIRRPDVRRTSTRVLSASARTSTARPASDPHHGLRGGLRQRHAADVSWLFPTSVASEHPSFLPAAGAQFVASKIEALAANEDLWNSTVFILNYDENDGFFDHVPPITPPKGTAEEFATLTSPAAPPAAGSTSARGSGCPPSSSRPGRSAATSAPIRSTTRRCSASSSG